MISPYLPANRIAYKHVDFDFGAIDDAEDQWSARYRNIFMACFHPLYLMLPILDTWLLSSKRQHMHQELTSFLCIMDARIRQASNLSSGSESLAEKDLLTLILETRKEHLGYMDDEDIRVWYLYCVSLHIQLTACVNVCYDRATFVHFSWWDTKLSHVHLHWLFTISLPIK